MENRIIYTNPDGSVAVVVPAVADRDMTELAQAVVPKDAASIRQITTADLPSSRIFRDAWDDTNPEPFVGVNAGKAAIIAHVKRRAKRDSALAVNLDIIKKGSAGIPLGPNENASAAAAENDAYMADVDDVAQTAINEAEIAGDVTAMEVALLALGITE